MIPVSGERHFFFKQFLTLPYATTFSRSKMGKNVLLCFSPESAL